MHVREMVITRSNQGWALDPNQIAMARGLFYVTAVADLASRRSLAHKVTIKREDCHARKAVEMAFAHWGPTEVVTTDQGGQLAARELSDATLYKGCHPSMDGRGAWCDNVFGERLWRSGKYGRVCLKA